jgi:23S rRNA pseudouridine2605 synthase
MSMEPPVPRERIAKRIARAGLASRRAAEALIAEGRVAVNGSTLTSPATDVGPDDRITVDGRPLPEAEPVRLWRYHKPVGLITTAHDQRARPTVFENLPADLPRVISVGRLDIASEGLLLLTNDGALKSRLESPKTGWLRRYRVRAMGSPDDAALEPLRRGITVDGERFRPMTVTLDRQQGANVWLTIGLREGRYREVRRALAAIGLTVNRLIRLSYGPFQLGDLAPGAVEEVRPRVLRDQLGLGAAEGGETPQAPATTRRDPKRDATRPARGGPAARRRPVRP